MKENRIMWLDITRSLAISSIVFCHALQQALNMTNNEWQNFGVMSRLLWASGLTFGRLGVPLFLCISGSLLLRKEFLTNNDGIAFYKKNLMPLFISVEVWLVAYEALIGIRYHNFPGIRNVILEALFLKPPILNHMWYMPVIMVLYVAVPFFCLIKKYFSRKLLKYPITICAFYSIIIPSANLLFRTLKYEGFSSSIDISLLGGCYGVYFIVGYWFSKDGIRSISTKMVWIISLFNFILSFAFLYLCADAGIEYNLWYDFLTLFIASIFLFEAIHRMESVVLAEPIQRIITYMSKYSLGIFFLHRPIQMAMYRPLKNQPISVAVSIGFFCSIILSFVIVKLFARIKFLKKYVFLVK